MSNFPPPPQDEFVAPQVVEKRGMSGGAKVLLVLGGIFGLCCLLCCGGVITLAIKGPKLMENYMDEAMSEDPVVIAQRRVELLEIDIPESFQPKGSMDIVVPFVDKRFMMVVAYEGDPPSNSIVLVGLGDSFSGMSPEEMEIKIKESLEKEGLGQPENDANLETKTKNFTIGGRKTTFVYGTEVDEEGKATRFHVTGTVRGKQAPVFVMITADADQFSEEDLDEIIESIEPSPVSNPVPVPEPAPVPEATPAPEAR